MSRTRTPSPAKIRGFTAIELMCVVTIIGILAAVAIPNFTQYQNRARATEAVINAEAIAYLEKVRILEVDEAIACEKRPEKPPSGGKTIFEPTANWLDLGFKTAGEVYFSYEVRVDGGDKTAFTVHAEADLDGDGETMSYTLDGRTMKASRIIPE